MTQTRQCLLSFSEEETYIATTRQTAVFALQSIPILRVGVTVGG